MNLADIQIETLSQHASQAAELLKVLELSGMSQSNVSQHLARIRGSGVVDTRRDGTTIYYRLANDDIKAIIDMLCDRFGPQGAKTASN
jgi:DNA-binding transcriptional ArsR family regulator